MYRSARTRWKNYLVNKRMLSAIGTPAAANGTPRAKNVWKDSLRKLAFSSLTYHINLIPWIMYVARRDFSLTLLSSCVRQCSWSIFLDLFPLYGFSEGGLVPFSHISCIYYLIFMVNRVLFWWREISYFPIVCVLFAAARYCVWLNW